MNMGGMGKKYFRVFVLLAMVGSMSYIPGIQTVQAEPDALALKIMPFGDSITSSYSPSSATGAPMSSYRCWLDHMLDAANVYFIYSGSRYLDSYGKVLPPCGDPATDFDPRNEGYSGYPTSYFLNPVDANYIDKILERKIYNTDKVNIPQIVLMHLGTNDLGWSPPVPIPQIVANLASLIDHFRAYNPTVAVLVAQIIPCAGHDWCSQVAALNAAIPEMAAQKNTLVSPVMVVDMYSDYTPTVDNDFHNNDYVHPNSSGDLKMATRWMEAIQKYLNRSIVQTYIPEVINP